MLILGACLCLACQKDETLSGSELQPPEKLRILWRSRIMEPQTNFGSLSMNPVLHDKYVVCNSEYTFDGKSAPVLFHDTVNGEILKSWSDYIDGPAVYTREATAQVNDYLILCQNGSVNCLNLNSGTTAWQSTFASNRPLVYAQDSYVYMGVNFNDDQGAAILRTPVDQAQWDTVYSFNRTDRFIPFFDSMGFGELTNGDKVLVWKNRSHHLASWRTDIFAYNLSADSLLWRNMDLNFDSGILPLQVEDGRVYGVVFDQIFSLDLANGEIIWSRDFQGLVAQPKLANFDLGAMTISGSKLILKGDGPELVYLNKRTGSADMIINMTDGVRDRFSQYKNYLVFSTGISIEFVEKISGKSVFSTFGDTRFSAILSKILIDPNRKVLYFHDGNYLYCARIPSSVQ